MRELKKTRDELIKILDINLKNGWHQFKIDIFYLKGNTDCQRKAKDLKSFLKQKTGTTVEYESRNKDWEYFNKPKLENIIIYQDIVENEREATDEILNFLEQRKQQRKTNSQYADFSSLPINRVNEAKKTLKSNKGKDVITIALQNCTIPQE